MPTISQPPLYDRTFLGGTGDGHDVDAQAVVGQPHAHTVPTLLAHLHPSTGILISTMPCFSLHLYSCLLRHSCPSCAPVGSVGRTPWPWWPCPGCRTAPPCRSTHHLTHRHKSLLFQHLLTYEDADTDIVQYGVMCSLESCPSSQMGGACDVPSTCRLPARCAEKASIE